jgi:hypothetical protein
VVECISIYRVNSKRHGRFGLGCVTRA